MAVVRRESRGGAAAGPRAVFFPREWPARLGVAAALALAPAGCRGPGSARPVVAGEIAHVAITESSGLAPSRRAPDLLWTHNDSGGEPVLYAMGIDGAFRGAVRLADLKNADWEDLVSFEWEGRAWLLVGDTGNTSKDCALYVVAEPDPRELSPTRELTADVAWKVPVRYPDGPHDCEAVAVDTREAQVYLLRKRERPNKLFVLPLRPPADLPAVVAREVGSVARLPQPSSQQRALPVPTGRYRGQPTSMAFAADGRVAAVLTYGDVLLFPRRSTQSWASALAASPVVLAPHGLGQAEALCFSADGKSLFVTEEKVRGALLRYDGIAELSAP